MIMEREKLGSRLGFILLSAGCAIGCGNVWKFPWICHFCPFFSSRWYIRMGLA